MSRSALADGLRQLRYKMAAPQRREDRDEQLLHDFLTTRDDDAFAVLVHRHGPMVLHICRRVLEHEQDAEDAFQATFLVLARNAASLQKKASLVSFLHGTAYRTAMKAKQSAARRRKHEGSLGALTQPRSPVDPAEEISWREVRTLLDEEISRLPEKYRSVFILCCLENVSRAEAAQRLSLKERTVLSRLAEARKRLAKRLARRGVELTAVLAATAVATGSTSALPMGLMTTTIEAAMVTATGEGLAGVVSASVAELVQGAMMVSKGKIATIVFLAMSLLGGAGVWAYRDSTANAVMPSAQPAEPPAAKADEKPKAVAPKTEATKTVEIQGRVLDPDGKPKAGAKLVLFGWDEKTTELGVAAADGRFTVAVPKEARDRYFRYLAAQAEDSGLDFLSLDDAVLTKPVELHLVKDQVIRGRILNTEGQPVRGARVAVRGIDLYTDNSLDSFLVRWKKRQPNSQFPNGVNGFESESNALCATRTDAEGHFTLRGAGAERLVTLRLSGAGIADAELWVVNRDGFDAKPYNDATRRNIPKDQKQQFRFGNAWLLHGPEVAFIAEPEKILRGLVTEESTGKPRPGVSVWLTHYDDVLLRLTLKTKTDAKGHYEIRGAKKAPSYTLEVFSDAKAGFIGRSVKVADTDRYLPVYANIKVTKGVIVTGKVLDKSTGKPVPGYVHCVPLAGNPFAEAHALFAASAWARTYGTEEDGTFRVVTIPGPGLLLGGPDAWSMPGGELEAMKYKKAHQDPKYPQYFNERGECLGVFGNNQPLQWAFCKVLELKPGDAVVKQDILLELASALTVKIQDEAGYPLTGVWAMGLSSRNSASPVHLERDVCSAYDVQENKPRVVIFYDPSRKLAGTLTLKGAEKSPVVAKLQKTGALKGRLLDADGKPMVGIEVEVNYNQRTACTIHDIIYRDKRTVTGADGAFALDELIPDVKFEMTFRRGQRRFERAKKSTEATMQLKPGECRDLGAIKLKQMTEKPGE
jgi:RNA polymerase sigma factor (sigma-70 family)